MQEAAPLRQQNGIFENRAFTRPSNGASLSCAILVVGGSTAAYTTALMTAQANLDVILVQPTQIVGGQFTTQALPASDDGDLLKQKITLHQVAGETFAISRFQKAFRDRQRQLQPVNGKVVDNPGGGWVSPICTSPVVAATAMNEAIAPFLARGNLKLVPFAEPVDVLFAEPRGERRRVVGVVFRDEQTNARFTIRAQVTVEATDLGDLLELGNIESRVGQEARHETGEAALPEKAIPMAQQSFTFGAVVELAQPGKGIPIGAPQGYNQEPWMKAAEFESEFWMKSGGKWEPRPRPFLDPYGIFRYRRLRRVSDDLKTILPGDVTVLNWGQHQHGENGPWLCGNDYRLGELVGVSREERRLHLKRARDRTRAYVHFLQSRGIPLKPRGDLTWTHDGIALEPYIREARRGVALTTIRHEDVSAAFFPNQARARSFQDSVGIGDYHYLDLHGNDEPGHASLPGNQVLTLPFTLPLSALVPINTDGLILSAKSLGTTHITNAAYRMHPVEWAIGEASGYLAAFCCWLNLSPREIATSEAQVRRVQGLMTRNGIPIFWFDDIGHDDPDFEAIQVMAAAGVVRSVSASDLHFRPQANVSRAVVATALVNVMGFTPARPATPTFTDVPPTHWAYGNIEALAEKQILAGIGGGQFAPSQPITRQQLGYLVRRALPAAMETAFARTPQDRQPLTRRELSRVLYEVLRHRLGIASRG